MTKTDLILEMLLAEAKDPEAYWNDQFQTQYQLLKKIKGVRADDLALFKKQVINLFTILKTNDRIQWFIPFIKTAMHDRFGPNRWDTEGADPEQKASYDKWLKKLTKKVDPVQDYTDMNSLSSAASHFFRHSNIPSIQNFVFTGQPLKYREVIDKLHELEKLFRERASQFLDPRTDDPDSAKVIVQLKDSKGIYYEWVDLNTNSCPTKEADVMKHCGDNDRADSMLSLRTPLNKDQAKAFEITKEEQKYLRKPVLTFAVEENEDDKYTLVESHGISNIKPEEKYHEAIMELFRKEIITAIDQRGAYKPENTFRVDDLNSEQQEELEDLGVEEGSPIPTFDEDDIKAAKSTAEAFNNDPAYPYVSVYAEEEAVEYDEHILENGIPYRIEIVVEINLDDLNIDLPEEASNYRFWNQYSMPLSNAEYDNGELRMYDDDMVYSYPEQDKLDLEVKTAIYAAEVVHEDIVKEFLPQLYADYSSVPELSEILDSDQIDWDIEDGGKGQTKYEGEILSIKIKELDINNEYYRGGWTLAGTSLLQDKFNYIFYGQEMDDPNQTESQFESFSQFFKKGQLLKEGVTTDKPEGLNLEISYRVAYSFLDIGAEFLVEEFTEEDGLFLKHVLESEDGITNRLIDILKG